jgi:ribosomal protein S2
MAWWNANFVTIRKAVKKMATIDKMKKDGTFMTLSKKSVYKLIVFVLN